MNKLLGALVLVMLAATVGCVKDPHVEKGGGEQVALEKLNGRPTGRIDVLGHVVNTGGSKALNVELHFKFLQDGTLFLEDRMQLGEISAGNTKSFLGSFYGPPVNGALTWEYRITWD